MRVFAGRKFDERASFLVSLFFPAKNASARVRDESQFVSNKISREEGEPVRAQPASTLEGVNE